MLQLLGNSKLPIKSLFFFPLGTGDLMDLKSIPYKWHKNIFILWTNVPWCNPIYTLCFQKEGQSISTSKSSLSHAVDRLQNTLYSETPTQGKTRLWSHYCGNPRQEPIQELHSGGLLEASHVLNGLGRSVSRVIVLPTRCTPVAQSAWSKAWGELKSKHNFHLIVNSTVIFKNWVGGRGPRGIEAD